MILAIDPATICGWAAAAPGGEISFGALRLGPPGCGLGSFAFAATSWLRDRIMDFRPKHIVYERPYIPIPRGPRLGKLVAEGSGPPPMNADTVFKLATIAGLIEMAAHEAGIECHEVTTAQACKFLTGHGRWGGRAQKKAAVMEMCKRYGLDVKNDNEADAIAILLYGESIIYPEAAMRRSAGPLFLGRST